MPDISMCQNHDCPKAKECYRYMAIPKENQAYNLFENICYEGNGYEWFWDIANVLNANIRKE